MVVKHQQRLRMVNLRRRLDEMLTEGAGIEFAAQAHQRIHRQLQLVVQHTPVPRVEVGGLRHIGLTDQHPLARVTVDHGAQAPNDAVNLRKVVGVDVAEVGVALGIVAAECRLIAQFRILEQRGDGVETEAGDAAIQPEAHRGEHGVLDLRVAPVQIRLLPVEHVVVELIDCRHVPPGRATEQTHPVVGGQALTGGAGLAVVPDVEAMARGIAGARRFQEPGVLVGGVVEHHVEQHTDVAFAGLRQQAVKVRQRAVLRIHVLVVGDVIAEIDLRRGIHRCDPDGIDTERLQVIEPLRDAVEIADAVAVGILKAAWIDLVDHRVLPPGVRRSVRVTAGRVAARGGPAGHQAGTHI